MTVTAVSTISHARSSASAGFHRALQAKQPELLSDWDVQTGNTLVVLMAFLRRATTSGCAGRWAPDRFARWLMSRTLTPPQIVSTPSG